MRGWRVINPDRESWLMKNGEIRRAVPDARQATRFASYWAADKACRLMNQIPVWGDPDTKIGRLLLTLKVRRIRKTDRLRKSAYGRRK